MREIKFRAKEKKSGCWLYGLLYQSAMGNWFIKDCANRAIYPIDPDTISQYTGLKDKDGKEIFEGDIISLRKYIAEVIWNSRRASFCLRFSFEKQVGTEPLGAWINGRQGCRIIGNIFDNKNLLKQ